MRNKDVKFLHFTDEEEKEYKEAKNMLRNSIVTLLIIVSMVIIVLTQVANRSLTSTQIRMRDIFFVLSTLIIIVSLIAIFAKKKCINDIKNKY